MKKNLIGLSIAALIVFAMSMSMSYMGYMYSKSIAVKVETLDRLHSHEQLINRATVLVINAKCYNSTAKSYDREGNSASADIFYGIGLDMIHQADSIMKALDSLDDEYYGKQIKHHAKTNNGL